MADKAQSRERSSRQACEPCRKKKIKCTAEAPACSCCQRLGQACVYATRSLRPARQNKRRQTSLRAKFQLLETQVNDLHERLQSNQDEEPERRPSAADVSAQGTSLTNETDTPIPAHSFSSYPPSEIISHVTCVYQTMIHLQPLPLFRPSDLSQHLTSFPSFLQHTCIALALSLKPHPIYSDRHAEAVDYYQRSARETVNNLALQGIPALEVSQALCLLILLDILGCKPHQAQMTIRIASQLESSRTEAMASSGNSSVDRDLSLRCRWSVHILERLFSSHSSMHDENMERLGFPCSAPVPPVLPPARQEDYPADLYNTYDSDHDLGITAYYIRMTLLLGSISPWLRDLRLAKYERPCSPDSTYAKLVARLYEYDSQLPSKHLLRNVAFSKRSPAEILEHRDYWTPWILMEVECHACLSILNHPFIHLVASRKCSKSSQSGLFLQQTVDAALLNSGWFFRLLRSCDGHQLELWDPVLGHLVAAVATIPWMLQYVRDESISQQAIKDLAWCKEYLQRLSTVWPHLSRKLEILRNLQLITDRHGANSEDTNGGIAFPPALLWEILDPQPNSLERAHRSFNKESPRSSPTPDTQIHITTHLRHPLKESPANQTAPSTEPQLQEPVLFSPEDLDQMYIDDLFGHFGTRYA